MDSFRRVKTWDAMIDENSKYPINTNEEVIKCENFRWINCHPYVMMWWILGTWSFINKHLMEQMELVTTSLIPTNV